MCLFLFFSNDKRDTEMYTVLTKVFDFFFQNVAVVEMSDSDTDEEILTSEDDWESEDDCIFNEVTTDNIKFPNQKREKGKIEILDSKVNK